MKKLTLIICLTLAFAMQASGQTVTQKEKEAYDKAVRDNRSVQESFEAARGHYNSGIEHMGSRAYDLAISEFEESVKVDPKKHIELSRMYHKSYANIAEAHYQIGVKLFNAKQPNSSEHFLSSIESINKALKVAVSEENVDRNMLIVYLGILSKTAILQSKYYELANTEEVMKWLDYAATIDSSPTWAKAKDEINRNIINRKDLAAKKAEDSLYEYSVKITKPLGVKDYIYEDAFIKIYFMPIENLGFKLENKTDEIIEIDWQRVSFVDFTGQANRVMHEGVRYVERDRALPPTIIPPTANIIDMVVPVSFISYDSGTSAGWKTRNLFDGGIDNYIGKPFSLLLPIKIGAVTKNYFFTFVAQKKLKSAKGN